MDRSSILTSKSVFLLKTLIASTLGLLILSGCAGRKHLVPPTQEPVSSVGLTDTILEEVESLYVRKDYQTAIRILKSVSQKEYTYYRLDEVLYWIGKCRYMQHDYGKADRAFSLLHQFYPRSDASFEDFHELRLAVRDSLETYPELRYAANQNHDHNTSSYANSGTHESEEIDDQPRVTNVFYETDIRQALADISSQTGVSIVPDNFVNGYVTVELVDTPLEVALDQLLSPLGFTYKKMKHYYLVGSTSMDSPSFALLSETKTVRPKYLSCQEVKKLLPSVYEKHLRLDSDTNTLTITAPQSTIRRFEDDLQRIDLPKTQIMIEAMVVEMSKATSRSFGFDWSWKNRDGDEMYRITKFPPSSIDSTFISEFTKMTGAFDLRVALRALATKGKADIRANPRVATIDGHPAEIRIAQEEYFSLIQGSVNFPYFTLEKIPTGITLQITPYLGESSEITVDIETEVSDVVGTGASELPVTNVRTVNTRIRVMNGETIAIGGLVSERERKDTNRVPFLGEIPVLGALFGHTSTMKEESEIMILIVPHILINPREFEII